MAERKPNTSKMESRILDKKFIILGLILIPIGIIVTIFFYILENSQGWNEGHLGFLSFVLWRGVGPVLIIIGLYLILSGLYPRKKNLISRK